MPLVAHTKLGSYEVIAPIGAGGMGEVYRARDNRLERDVAIKVLPEGLARDEAALARFAREAKAVAALSHPNILAIFELGTENGTAFAVTELLDGETLRERLARGAIPTRKAVELAKEIAGGLAAAHEKGIVHRDLKPENVFVTKGGRVKILDFGLARQAAPQTSGDTRSPTLEPGTEPGTVLGTVGYMSPEQVRGLAADARSDIFSFGTVLYEMLTGRRAFQRETAAETMTAILREDPPELSASGARVPSGIDRVVHHCLEKEPEERFRSAHDLAFALEAAAGTTSATGSAAIDTTRPAPRVRRAAALGIGAAGVLAGVLLGVVAARLARREPEARPVAIRPMTYSGQDGEPSVSPDGATIAFTSSRDGTKRIWLKQVSGGGEVALTTGHDSNARFSPDGTQLLFVRGRLDSASGADLYRVPVLGGEPRRVATEAREGDWSPDGRRIAFVRIDARRMPPHSSLMLVPVEGGEPAELARFENRLLQLPRFSPDGRTIAVPSFPAANAGGRIELVDVETRRVRVVEPPPSLGNLSSAAWTGGGAAFLYAQQVNVRFGGGRVFRCDTNSLRSTLLLFTSFETAVLEALGPGQLLAGGASSRQNLSQLSLSGPSPERWLTRGTSTDRQPVFSPDGEWVAFSSNRGGNIDVWEISLKNGAVRRLTEDPADDWDPGFTHDGKLLWSSGRGGHFEIWIAEADGTSPRRVTDDGADAENPTETPDGWIVYYSGNAKKRGLWKIRPDGTQATKLGVSRSNTPDVSPDGVYVACPDSPFGATTIHVVRVSDGKELPFRIAVACPRPTETILGRVRWLPGGRALAFVGQDEKGVNGIYVQDFDPGKEDTSATRRALGGFDPDRETESFAISPDGSRLVVAGLERLYGIQLIDGVAGVSRPRGAR